MKYELTTIKDIFDKVPVDRIEACLDELAKIIIQSKHLNNSMCEAVNLINGSKPDNAIRWPDMITWIDDGKGELIARVLTENNDELLKIKTKINPK